MPPPAFVIFVIFAISPFDLFRCLLITMMILADFHYLIFFHADIIDAFHFY